MSAPIPEQLLAPSPGQVVELFKIDPTPISAGAAVFYVTPNTDAAGGSTLAPTVTRDGIDYYGIPIEGEGFQRGGDGAMPQPILTVANVAGLLLPWIEGAEDMIGCEVRRTTVLQSWLDGEPAADPTAFITDDVFIIEQKTRQSPIALEFRLRAAVDRADFKLPGRLCLPTCSYRYRVWDSAAGAWDYTKATCPYTGASMFTWLDAVTTTETEDLCSKELSGCKARFPSVPLPTTAFPGLGNQ